MHASALCSTSSEIYLVKVLEVLSPMHVPSAAPALRQAAQMTQTATPNPAVRYQTRTHLHCACVRHELEKKAVASG